MLKNVGVFNLHNFWYLLRHTWIERIQAQFPNTDKKKVQYLRHIKTASNSNLHHLQVDTPLELDIFFTTLALVFNIKFKIFNITNQSWKEIDPCTAIVSYNLNIRITISNSTIVDPILSSTFQFETEVLLFFYFFKLIFLFL
jgi:hypothetical protein